MELEEFSGIIGMDVRIVLFNKINNHKAEILPKKNLFLFSFIQKHDFPTARHWYQFLWQNPRQSGATESLNNDS